MHSTVMLRMHAQGSASERSLVGVQVVELFLGVFQSLGCDTVLLLQQWYYGGNILQVPAWQQPTSALSAINNIESQTLEQLFLFLQAVFSRAQGPECIFLWPAIGAALVSVVPTASYSLKVLPSAV